MGAAIGESACLGNVTVTSKASRYTPKPIRSVDCDLCANPQGALGKFGGVELSDVLDFVELSDGKYVSTTESGHLLVWEGSLIKVRRNRLCSGNTVMEALIIAPGFNSCAARLSLKSSGFCRWTR